MFIFNSAALFYIVKMKEKGELEARLKRRIVRTLLVGMSIHKNEETMMRNGCLTLYQFRLPQDVVCIVLVTCSNSICSYIVKYILKNVTNSYLPFIRCHTMKHW